jgi:hypothetical protein
MRGAATQTQWNPMIVEQAEWNAQTGWDRPLGFRVPDPALVFVFGERTLLASDAMQRLAHTFSDAVVVGCSTAGNILGTAVTDATVGATAIQFETGSAAVSHIHLAKPEDSAKAGARLAAGLPRDGLRHVLVLSEGIRVNGSALAEGMVEALPAGVLVTGGLAADGTRFEQTFVIRGCGGEDRTVTAIGIYGKDVHIGHGCQGGWEPFGPDLTITESNGNVLHSLDGERALNRYRLLLGVKSVDLPSSGLSFPLELRAPGTAQPVVRTLLAIDPDEGSVTFAGDMPEGATVRFMKASLDGLLSGARDAAADVRLANGRSPDFALLISCVGRRQLLGARTCQEIENVRAVLGEETKLAGFYSYGEISPYVDSVECGLHNQTMTITTISEH